jgi:hypothetical protein
MKKVYGTISLAELRVMSHRMYGNLVKAVVDVDREVMAVDMDMHVDGETELLEQGSEQKNLWGITIHPEKSGEKPVEFDSVINIRPSQGNRGRGVDNAALQKKIVAIVNKLVAE